jgi:hypothetical protein
VTATMRKVLASLVPVICPPEAATLGIEADIVEHVGLSVSALPPLLQRGLALGLATYDLAALPRFRRRAHKLAPAEAERHFLSWLHGLTPMQRQMAIAVKQLLALAHYEHPRVQEAMGYRPTQWIEKVKRRRLELYADDIGRHQASLIAPDPLPGVRSHRRKLAR